MYILDQLFPEFEYKYLFRSQKVHSAAEMDTDLKAKMNEDLERELDHLYSMKLQPELHLAKKFDSIISTIDFDAERIILDLGEASIGSRVFKMAEKVNQARCEYVRILRDLEKHLAPRSATKTLGEAFQSLDRRVNEFREKEASQFDDIFALEDWFVQLVLEINEMTKAEESTLMTNETIFYNSSTDKSKLGNLFHFKGLTEGTLTEEQIDFLRYLHETWYKQPGPSLHLSILLSFSDLRPAI